MAPTHPSSFIHTSVHPSCISSSPCSVPCPVLWGTPSTWESSELIEEQPPPPLLQHGVMSVGREQVGEPGSIEMEMAEVW